MASKVYAFIVTSIVLCVVGILLLVSSLQTSPSPSSVATKIPMPILPGENMPGLAKIAAPKILYSATVINKHSEPVTVSALYWSGIEAEKIEEPVELKFGEHHTFARRTWTDGSATYNYGIKTITVSCPSCPEPLSVSSFDITSPTVNIVYAIKFNSDNQLLFLEKQQ